MPYVVNGQVQDTGWYPIVFNAGFGNQGNWKCQIRRIGDIVYLDGIMNRTGGFAAATNYNPFVIPALAFSTFRPWQITYLGPMASASSAQLGTMIVYDDGTVEYRNTHAMNYVSLTGLFWFAPSAQSAPANLPDQV